MNNQQHLIIRNTFEIKTDDQQQAQDIQAVVVDCYDKEIIPLLDTLFSDIVPPDIFIVIDQLEINFDSDGNNFKEQLYNSIINQVKDQLHRYIQELKSGTTSSVSLQVSPTNNFHSATAHPELSLPIIQARIEALKYFIAHGIFPWWYHQQGSHSLIFLLTELQQQDPEVLSKVVLSMLTDKRQRQRIALQFPERVLHDVMIILGKEIQSIIRDLRTRQIAHNTWQIILTLIASCYHNSFPVERDLQHLKYRLEEIIKSTTEADGPQTSDKIEIEIENNRSEIIKIDEKSPSSIEKDSPQTLDKIEDEKSPSSIRNLDTDKLFVQNAGLVVFWPYLFSFFSGLDLLNGQQFKGPEEQAKACLALHYLESGNYHAEEHELLLNKILCGLDIEEPVPAEITLSPIEIEESEALIEAVIANWPALKSTSKEAFRETFLMREGYLSFQEDSGWTLKVDRKGLDILVDMIPWGIGMIRLPWNSYFIYTDW